MVSSQRLTRRTVAALKYDPSGSDQQILYEGGPGALTGFGVRVHESGKKSWVVKYRFPRGRAGRVRLFSIGSVELLPLEEARERARRLLLDALDGKDPAEQRDRERNAPTLAELATAYLAEGAPERSRENYAQRLRDYVVPELGRRQAQTISRADLARLHRRLWDELSGGSANRVLAIVSALYTWAEKLGHVPFGHANPCGGIERAPVTSRDRWCSPEELRRLFEALSKHESVHFKAFVLLSLLLGTRKNELLRARWDQVSFEQRTLRLPETKNGRVHSVPLSSAALEILASLPREAGSPYVFPGQRSGGHLKNVDRAWQGLRKAAGIPDVWLHDLRRTCGSLLAQHGASLQLVGAVLNHQNQNTTRIYARLADRNRVDALEAHGARLLELVQPPASSVQDLEATGPAGGSQ